VSTLLQILEYQQATTFQVYVRSYNYLDLVSVLQLSAASHFAVHGIMSREDYDGLIAWFLLELISEFYERFNEGVYIEVFAYHFDSLLRTCNLVLGRILRSCTRFRQNRPRIYRSL
jgi:hypothetical protein